MMLSLKNRRNVSCLFINVKEELSRNTVIKELTSVLVISKQFEWTVLYKNMAAEYNDAYANPPPKLT